MARCPASSVSPTSIGLLALLLSGCVADFLTRPRAPNDGGPNPPSIQNTRLLLDPEAISLDELGRGATFTAGWWRDGDVTPAGGCVWTIDDRSVGTVDGEGRVTATGNGQTLVRARCGDTTATAALGVWQSVAGVAVAPERVELEMGESVRLVAVARDPGGNLIERAVSFVWSSSNDVAVDVAPDQNGASRATATRYLPGRADVKAHAETKVGTVRVED